MGKRGQPSMYSPEQWGWIAARYLEGYSSRELGDFAGVSQQHIAQTLCKMGVKRTEPLPSLENRRAEFNALIGRCDY